MAYFTTHTRIESTSTTITEPPPVQRFGKGSCTTSWRMVQDSGLGSGIKAGSTRSLDSSAQGRHTHVRTLNCGWVGWYRILV